MPGEMRDGQAATAPPAFAACAMARPSDQKKRSGCAGVQRKRAISCRFHQAMRDDGFTRPFKGHIEKWAYAPLDDMKLVADRIQEMLGKR